MSVHQLALMPAAQAGITISWLDRPFVLASARRHVILPGGVPPTLREIVDATPGLPPLLRRHGAVEVNGVAIPREAWGRTRPRFSARVPVHVHIYPGFGNPGGAGGGAGGQKNTMTTVATLALLAAGAAVSGGALAFGGGGFFGAGFLAAGSWQATALGATIGIGGALAVAALSGPPSMAAIAGPVDPGAGIGKSGGAAASLSVNVLEPGGTPPRIAGTRRVFLPGLSRPLTEIVNGTERVEVVMAASGPHSFSAVQLDGVDVADMADSVVTEIQQGKPDSAIQTLIGRYGVTTDCNIALPKPLTDPDNGAALADQADLASVLPKWTSVRTALTQDEFWLQFDFPSGLIQPPNTALSIPIRIRIRQRGVPGWKNLPELHFNGRNFSDVKKGVKLCWRGPPDIMARPKTANAAVLAYTHVSGQDGVAVTPASPDWDADPSFSSTGGHRNFTASGTTFTCVGHGLSVNDVFIPKSTGNLPNGLFAGESYYVLTVLGADTFQVAEWEVGTAISVSGGSGTHSFVNTPLLSANYNYNAPAALYARTEVKNVDLLEDYAVIYLAPGTFPKGAYDVQVKMGVPYDHASFDPARYYWDGRYDYFAYHWNNGVLSVPNDLNTLSYNPLLRRYSAVVNANPVRSTKFATLSMRLTGRSSNQISVLASGLVPGYNSGAWNGAYAASSNPALQLVYLLTGPLAARPAPLAMLDLPTFAAFRQSCIDNDYLCDAILDGKSGLDAARLIASCGYGRLGQAEKFYVIMDRDTTGEEVTQIFSPRNMNAFGFERAFARRADGLRVRFGDKDDDYREGEEVVMDPDAVPGTSLRLEEIVYDGFVRRADARARALFDLKQARLRSTFYSGVIGPESIESRRGDLVGLQHDVLTGQDPGFARIKSVKTGGAGNVTGLILDGSIPVKTVPDLFVTPNLFNTNLFDLGARTGITIRLNDQTLVTREVTALAEEATDIDFVATLTWPGTVATADGDVDKIGAGCHVVSGRLGLACRRMKLFEVVAQKNHAARVVLVDEAPELF